MEQVYPILWYLQAAFTIWMLVDAYQRGAEIFWYWIILCIPGIGAWAYFFAVKAGDHQLLNLANLFHRRVPLDELRYQAEHVPTLTSHLALAERLIEMKEHTEAMQHLESARKREPEHPQVLYLLALCYTETENPAQAVPLLEKVIERDRRWSDYMAWRLLIRVRKLGNESSSALESARDLARIAPTLQHRCLLAELLLDEGKHDEAYELLEQSLEEHRYAPSLSRRRNRPWASQARRLQKRAAAGG